VRSSGGRLPGIGRVRDDQGRLAIGLDRREPRSDGDADRDQARRRGHHPHLLCTRHRAAVGLRPEALNLMTRQIASLISALYLALVFIPVRLPAQNRTSSSQRPGETQSIESLRSRLAAHLNQTRFDPASWGVKAVSLDTGRTLFEQNSQKLFSPASNAKLYTAALALDRLGPDFKVRTSLYSASKPDSSGTVRGDLVVYWRGAPLMTARLTQGDYFKPLDPLVSTLVNNGVKKIDGDVIGDDSYFTGPPFGAGWEWDDLQTDYGAEVSALSVEDNCVDLFVKPAERVGLPCPITMGP